MRLFTARATAGGTVLAPDACMALLTVSNEAILAGRWPARALSVGRTIVFTCVAAALPLSTAFAQSAHFVRVAEDQIDIRSHQERSSDVVMKAERGTIFEVIYTDGDRFAHRKGNWYWILLPRDSWGMQRAGWVSGRQVDEMPRTETAAVNTSMKMTLDPVDAQPASRPGAGVAATAEPAAAKPPAAASPAPASEVVLNFEFGKSSLTADARTTLNDVLPRLNGSGPVSLAVEGYADAIGSEPFNQRLGLERAETVKRYLAEHKVPSDQIGVISYGEAHPAASNATEQGRKENRRVVVKVGR